MYPHKKKKTAVKSCLGTITHARTHTITNNYTHTQNNNDNKNTCMPEVELVSFLASFTTQMSTRISGQCDSGATCTASESEPSSFVWVYNFLEPFGQNIMAFIRICFFGSSPLCRRMPISFTEIA